MYELDNGLLTAAVLLVGLAGAPAHATDITPPAIPTAAPAACSSSFTPTASMSGGIGTGILTTSAPTCEIATIGNINVVDESISLTLGTLGSAAGTLELSLPVTPNSNMGTVYCNGEAPSTSGTNAPGGAGVPMAFAPPGGGYLEFETVKNASTSLTVWSSLSVNLFPASSTYVYSIKEHCVIAQ